MAEVYVDIIGYEGLYQISNKGNVKNTKRNKVLSTGLRRGYPSVILYKSGFRKNFTIHRLVAEHFIPNPLSKPCVNHKDGNKENCVEDNLEWVTDKENAHHAHATGLVGKIDRKCSNNGRAKLTEEQVLFIRNSYIPRDKEFGVTALAKLFNVSKSTISGIINNTYWKNI